MPVSRIRRAAAAAARGVRQVVVGRSERDAGFRERVTFADVRAAYRLFLGRAPDPDGWRNCTAMVGHATVEELAVSILASDEFRRSPGYGAVVRHEGQGHSLVRTESGLRLYVSPHDVLNRQVLESGRYEAHLAAALDEVVAPGMSVCCVGANIGFHALRAASRVGAAGTVVAFEARPDNARLLHLNAIANDLTNVVILPLAVAESPGRYRYVPAQGTNGYIEPLERSGDPDPQCDRIFAQAVSLDSLFSLFPSLDVLQLDVEGAEGLVMRGAKGVLAKHRPWIFSELCLGQLQRTSSMSGAEYLGDLAELGYRFTAIRFDGALVSFARDVAGLVEYANAQPTSHIDIRCEPS